MSSEKPAAFSKSDAVDVFRRVGVNAGDTLLVQSGIPAVQGD